MSELDFERLSPEVVAIDGKYYRLMSDAEQVDFVWGQEAAQHSVQPTASPESDDPKPGTWAYFDSVTSKGG